MAPTTPTQWLSGAACVSNGHLGGRRVPAKVSNAGGPIGLCCGPESCRRGVADEALVKGACDTSSSCGANIL